MMYMLIVGTYIINPMGSKVFWGFLTCFDMPWHLCFFQLLMNILTLMSQVKLHSI